MPRLSCRTCGRQIYTAAPLESLFAEERRCPRCGALLTVDRRLDERRTAVRRENPPETPGPPEDNEERRTTQRRTGRRRRPANGERDGGPSQRSGGWVD